ncbi:efflux RND transporter periplasmic adaptor subunit [Pseudooceanicola sp. CBS1P-1]|uniref:Efflux RND transporter periplasmic adaptor subunit n=1 Tax=Pseudooceanicola albus TaxID=2692189 RepID=A0A6L7G822_9RHOB|nr:MULTISPECIES: efflux RND transporter periplasmic adaptor subunit [Pseudooceanicola]MBT9382855.1 efflux RND transporter periplasmic adaptor subunit [Pseudooceanicola endophyticus]MXN20221.1 efflux RND transporter periplasmic adaptor subunit [Pseudooceanicola albus]
MAHFSLASLRALPLALALLAGTTAQAQQGGQMPPGAVTVVTLEPQSLTLTSTLPGRVRAFAESEVRPQVNGIVTERLFQEGSDVSEGQVLYKIDATTYQAAVDQARASVTSAQATLRAAERDFDRVSALSDRGVSTQQSMDEATSSRDTARAQVSVAEAALRSAQIELDHTEVRARLSGRIGLSDVSQGALVTASQTTALATIRKLDVVSVDVTQSAAELLQWRRGQGVQAVEDADVALTLADGSTYEQTGKLTAAEPHVDEQTGVVVLRLQFPNPDGVLLPGMYVQVEMPTTRVENVFLVPQEAVSRDRRGNPTALVVNAENKVEPHPLKVLQDQGSDWVVTGGVAAGDRVIVAGMKSAAPGATVVPQERKTDAEAQASPGADASK